MWKVPYKKRALHSLPLRSPVIWSKAWLATGNPEQQCSSCPHTKVMALSGLVNIPRLQAAPARAPSAAELRLSSQKHTSDVPFEAHPLRRSLGSHNLHSRLWKVTSDTKSVLPHGVWSTAGTLSPCHKVKASPLPKAFSILGPHPYLFSAASHR